MCINWLYNLLYNVYNVLHVYKLTLKKTTLIKGWDKKLIKLQKIVQSKYHSDQTSEKMLNDNTQKLT